MFDEAELRRNVPQLYKGLRFEREMEQRFQQWFTKGSHRSRAAIHWMPLLCFLVATLAGTPVLALSPALVEMVRPMNLVLMAMLAIGTLLHLRPVLPRYSEAITVGTSAATSLVLVCSLALSERTETPLPSFLPLLPLLSLANLAQIPIHRTFVSTLWIMLIAYVLRWQLGSQQHFDPLGVVAELMLLGVAMFSAYQGEFGARVSWIKTQRLKSASATDPLTGLLNRRALPQAYESLRRQAQRSGDAIVLAVLDADHFKALNDSAGHQQGDDALVQLADALRQQARRPLDIAARIGGEEFLLVFFGCGLSDALQRLELLRAQIESMHIVNTGAPLGRLTCSIGAVEVTPVETRNLYQLIDLADQQLYRAKRAGRNRVLGVHTAD